MNNAIKLTGFGIELSTITPDKVEKIRAWRNHDDVAKYMLDKSYISQAQQINWFAGLENKAEQLHLLISYKGEDIGVINAKTQSGQSLQQAAIIIPGLYIAPECKYRNSILAFSPSLVFIDYLFSLAGFNKLLAQILPDNTQAIRYNQTLGYTQASVDKQGIITMELLVSDFERAKNKLAKILRF
jgi:RimJ/RimL family protein N-acetyltransferase